MSEIKMLPKLWTNTYIHICLRPWFWFKGALTYVPDSIVKPPQKYLLCKAHGCLQGVEERLGRMSTDWIIPALSVYWTGVLVAGTLQGDLSVCGSGTVCARLSWLCNGHPVNQNWPRQEPLVLLENLFKKRQYPLGKRNMRCKRGCQGWRDSWAGAKEEQEAHLGRRSREQELSRKRRETGEMQGLEGVSEQGQEWKPLRTELQRKAQEKVPHPKWQWPGEEPTPKKCIKKWGVAKQKEVLLIHNQLNCLEFPNFFKKIFFNPMTECPSSFSSAFRIFLAF